MAQVGVDDARRSARRAASNPSMTAVPSPSLPLRWMHLDAMPAREIVGERAGAVRRVVVDDDELAVEAPRRVRGKHRGDEIAETIALVVGGDDDRQRWEVGAADKGCGSRAL